MNGEIVRCILRTAFRSAAELQTLLPLIKDHCSAEEYESLRSGIATAIAAIGDEVTNRILAANPDLSSKIDAEIRTYGRLL
jgi:hypothetical protein